MSVRETVTQTDNKDIYKYNTLCMFYSTHLVRGTRNHLEAVAVGVCVGVVRVRVSVSVREGEREGHICMGIDMIYACTHVSPNIH